MLTLTVFWTVFSSSEYPPENVEEQKRRHREKRRIENGSHFKSKFLNTGLLLMVFGLILSTVIYSNHLEKELYVLGAGLAIFGVAFLVSSLFISQDRSHLGIVHITKDFATMPKTMVQLAYVQFFSWFALFSMWIYSTPAVTSHIFHSTDPTSTAYNEGANLVGNLFGGYNGIAAVAAFLLPVLAKHTSRRVTHLLALLCGGLGLISIYFISEPVWLWFSMIGVGIAWASILSVPYAMLSGSLPPEKMGYYMGVFNFFIVIPQIVAGTLLGFMLNKLFGGESVYILVAGGISMVVAAFLNLFVDDRE